MERNLIVSRYKSLSSPTKASLWFTVCSLINKGIQFLTVPVFTRLLSTEEYGQYSVFLSWQTIIIILITLNLYSNVLNNGLLKFKNDKYSLISSFQGLTTGIALCFLVASIVFRNQVTSILKLPFWIVVLMIFEIAVMPGFELWATNERFDYKYKTVVIITLAVAILNPLLGLVFVLNSSQRGYARIVSVLVSQFVIYSILYVYNIIKGKKQISIPYWKYALTLALPLVPHYLSQILLNQMDRIMISDYVGDSEAAIYSVAYSGAMIMQIVGKAVQSSFTPWIYKNIEAGNYNNIKSKSCSLIIIIGMLNFCVLCFAPEAIWVLGGDKYLQAVNVIPPVISSCFLIFVYSLFCTIEFYYEITKPMMFVSVFGAVLNYVTNYFFIRRFGYIAAGYTTLLCYIVFVVLHYLLMKSVLRKNGIKYIYNTRFIISFSIVFIAISFLLLSIYNNLAIRVVIFIFLLILGILKKDFLMKTFDKS